MATTYSTSAECALYAGMKTLSTNTRPSTAMVDLFREQVYSKIGQVIGTAHADNSNADAKAMELEVVKRAIQGVRDNKSYNIQLTEDERIILVNAFECWGLGTWEPDKDNAITG